MKTTYKRQPWHVWDAMLEGATPFADGTDPIGYEGKNTVIFLDADECTIYMNPSKDSDFPFDEWQSFRCEEYSVKNAKEAEVVAKTIMKIPEDVLFDFLQLIPTVVE